MKLSVLKIPGKENALRIIVDGWKARSDPVRYTLQTDQQDGTAAQERTIPPDRSIEGGVLSFEASDVGVAYESGFASARIDITDEDGTQHVGSGMAEPPGHLEGAARSAQMPAKSQIGADIVVSGHGEAVQVDPLALNAVSPADYTIVLDPGSGARITGASADPRVSVPIRRGAASEVVYSLQPREGGSPIAGTITATQRRLALSGLYLACLPLLLLLAMLVSLLQGPSDSGGTQTAKIKPGPGIKTATNTNTCSLSGVPGRHQVQLDASGRASIQAADLLPGLSAADRGRVEHTVPGGATVSLQPQSGGNLWMLTARKPYAKQVAITFECPGPGASSKTVTIELTPSPVMPRCILPKAEMRVRMPASGGVLTLASLLPDVDPARYRDLRFSSVRRGEAGFAGPRNGKIDVRIRAAVDEIGFRVECAGVSARGVLEIEKPAPPSPPTPPKAVTGTGQTAGQTGSTSTTSNTGSSNSGGLTALPAPPATPPKNPIMSCAAGNSARQNDMIYRTAFTLPQRLYRFDEVRNEGLRTAIVTAAKQIEQKGAFQRNGIALDKTYCVMRETLRMRDLVGLIEQGVVGISLEELKKRTQENAPGSKDGPASQMKYDPDVKAILDHVTKRGGGIGIRGADVISREVWFAALIFLAGSEDENLYRDFVDGVPEYLNSGPTINNRWPTIFGLKPQGRRGYEVKSHNSDKDTAAPVKLRLMWEK